MAGLFYQALKPKVQDKVHRRGKPHNLTNLAVEVDNHLQTQILEIKQQEQAGRLASGCSGLSPPLLPRTSADSSACSVAATTAMPSCLSQQECNECFASGACLYCGQQGHRKAFCPVCPSCPAPSIAAMATVSPAKLENSSCGHAQSRSASRADAPG